MRFLSFLCVMAVATLGQTQAAAASPIDVELGKSLARFGKLKPGVRHYLRYKIGTDGVATPMDLQRKEIRFDQQEGQRRLHILQHWQSATGALDLDSWFEDKTFRPLTHQRDRTRDATVTREGFRFLPDRIIGLADQPDNSRKDFEIAAPVPTFNFEADLETLQALPLKKGAEFRIVFYHPGGGVPAPYIFKVAGQEKLIIGGSPLDCWVVTTDYNDPKRPIARFWVAKDSQTVVKVVSPQPDGTTFVKSLLS
ncbi:MAG: hypothetical protein H0W74_04850 [Sphingosinicella sp.]|nr:hypothetical protein [Sphingosinicella sp.]